MMRAGLFSLSLLVCGVLHAQVRIVPLEQMRNRFESYSGTYHPEFDGYYGVDRPETFDTVRLLVTYDLSVRIDTLVRRDRVAAEVGRRYTKFYSLYLLTLSLNHADHNRRVEYPWMKDCSVMFPSVVCVDKVGRQITEQRLLPFQNNLFFTCTEGLPDISWTFEPRTQEIAGYRCLKARCRFRGRDWTVWYAPDIPSSVGFWKLHGLPGMILAATDADEEYRFTVAGIEQPSTPMLRYRVPSRQMDRERIRKTERAMYERPLDAFSAQTGQNYFVALQDGKLKLVAGEDDVSFPYNPIERE